jgi:hypothetical protein
LHWRWNQNQEKLNMRTILFAMVAAAGIALAGTSGSSAAPANGAVIDTAAKAGEVTEQVHCKRYPHRHRGGIPHGLGFGCKK